MPSEELLEVSSLRIMAGAVVIDLLALALAFVSADPFLVGTSGLILVMSALGLSAARARSRK